MHNSYFKRKCLPTQMSKVDLETSKLFFFLRVLSLVIFNSWHGVTDSSDDPVSMLKKKCFVLERVSCKIHNILINASLKSKTVDCWLIMTAVEIDGSLNLSSF